MLAEGKSSVQICQEMIAIYSARAEAADLLLDRFPGSDKKEKLKEIKENSNETVSRLREELTLFGDAVSSEVDRSNNYQTSLAELSELLRQGDEQQAMVRLEETEKVLVETREGILATAVELPEEIARIIKSA